MAGEVVSLNWRVNSFLVSLNETFLSAKLTGFTAKPTPPRTG